MARLARTWPGWDVRFAHDGMGDLTHHLGLGRDLTRAPGWFETFQPSGFADTEYADPALWPPCACPTESETVMAGPF